MGGLQRHYLKPSIVLTSTPSPKNSAYTSIFPAPLPLPLLLDRRRRRGKWTTINPDILLGEGIEVN